MSTRVKGATTVSLVFRLFDAATGAPKVGLDVTTLKLQFARPREAPGAATSLTLLGSQTAAWTPYGAIEKDPLYSQGVFRVDVPDAAFATGADEVAISITGTAIQAPPRLIDLLGVDLQNSSPYDGTLASAAAATITFAPGDPNAAAAAGRAITLIDLATRASQATVVGTLVSGQTFTVAPDLAAHAGSYGYILGAIPASGGGGGGTDMNTFFNTPMPGSPVTGSPYARIAAIGGPVASVAGPVNVNLAQALTPDTGGTVGGALYGAHGTAFGRVVKNVGARTLSFFGFNDQANPAKVFDLDDGTAPSTRTPR